MPIPTAVARAVIALTLGCVLALIWCVLAFPPSPTSELRPTSERAGHCYWHGARVPCR